jgi:hypothetical protein
MCTGDIYEQLALCIGCCLRDGQNLWWVARSGGVFECTLRNKKQQCCLRSLRATTAIVRHWPSVVEKLNNPNVKRRASENISTVNSFQRALRTDRDCAEINQLSSTIDLSARPIQTARPLPLSQRNPECERICLSEKAFNRVKTGCMFFFTYAYVNLLITGRQSYVRCVHRNCCCTQQNSAKE